MENWGLIIYREFVLLFDVEKFFVLSKFGIIMIVVYELGYQWFGNLVIMEWWNDFWLNEGFVKFMEFVFVSVIYFELKVGDYFFGKCFDVMEVDVLNFLYFVFIFVENFVQIWEMFDDVFYDKGVCILNMLREYFSVDVFKSGIVQYFQKYSYKNIKNEDLWDSMVSICFIDGVKGMDGFCFRS